MLFKLFQNWSGGFGDITIFHFLEVLKNFSYLGLSREPFEIRWCTRGQKSFHSWQENFWCSFFWPPVFNNGGVRENLSFSIMLNYLVTPLRYINTCREKVTTHDKKTFVGFCFDPMVITVVGWEITYLFLNNLCSTQLIYLKFYIWWFFGVP